MQLHLISLMGRRAAEGAPLSSGVEATLAAAHLCSAGAKLFFLPPYSPDLKRLGLNRIGALEPSEPVRRHERDKPGEMIHIDIKTFGRIDGIGHRITGDRRGQSNRRSRGQGLGWEFVKAHI